MGYDGVGVRICVPAEGNRAGERERKFDIEKEVGWAEGREGGEAD